jgi:hypothetical protein
MHLSDPERRLSSNVYPRRAGSNEDRRGLTRAFNVAISLAANPDRALRAVPAPSLAVLFGTLTAWVVLAGRRRVIVGRLFGSKVPVVWRYCTRKSLNALAVGEQRQLDWCDRVVFGDRSVLYC